MNLNIEGDKIHVFCEIFICKDTYTFSLLDSLEVKNIKNNGLKIDPFTIEKCTLQFRPQMKKYSFFNLDKGILSFEYEGTLDGWFLFMQEDIYHFSLYNGWYPIEFDVVEEYEVTVQCDYSYELINGEYNDGISNWYYSTKNQNLVDCNIILINKSKSFYFKNETLNLYYFNKKYEKYMQEFFDKYSSIYKYYISLYGKDRINQTSIIFLPEKYQMGAYKRENLIVFSEIDNEIERTMHTLAHEMAHSYATGANTSSWEDWLNETHAEWSALLYELEHNHEYFDFIIKRKIEEYKNGYSLKPKGDERPDNVHQVGTLIYYEIYKKYGKDSIKTLLRTFDELKDKNTENFINLLMMKDTTLANEIKIITNEE